MLKSGINFKPTADRALPQVGTIKEFWSKYRMTSCLILAVSILNIKTIKKDNSLSKINQIILYSNQMLVISHLMIIFFC